MAVAGGRWDSNHQFTWMRDGCKTRMQLGPGLTSIEREIRRPIQSGPASMLQKRSVERPDRNDANVIYRSGQSVGSFRPITGWRVGSMLALKWADVNLETGTALSLADDNKGNRDQFVPIHPLVVKHLEPLKQSFVSHVFPWNRSRRALYADYHRIQDAAKVKPARKERYGFHDLRRGFATYNADRMTPDALQALMAHKDYQTTQRYINMARQLKPAAVDVFVPEALKGGNPEGEKQA